MEKFTRLIAQAASLPIANIDTDMIIPKQHLKTIKRSGLGKWLFSALRYDDHGQPLPSFVLNQKPDAKILLAGENFGCGSSREHAPWSITDFGLRVVIAPSFADIFYNNSYKNGLLLIRLNKESVAQLAQSSGPITVDLESQKVTCGAMAFSFDIEANIKDILIVGLDAIEAILRYCDEIEAYEKTHFARQPWIKGETHA